MEGVSKVALEVAALAFPHLPVAAALEAIAELFAKPLSEISDHELDAYLVARLMNQRANLK